MSVTTASSWQSVIHSTTVIFSPEAREDVFRRFRSSPTVHSASLSYDAEENWFEIACLANDTDNASKTLALIISTFSAVDPAHSKTKIDVFPESVVDWRKWRRQLDEDDEEQDNHDEHREDLIDFGQASERREWIPADSNVDLDVLLPPSLLEDVAQLTGCELDRSTTQQAISIVPGPAGNSAAAARKLTNIEEERAQKYPVVSHVLRTQKVDRFGVLFMPVLDLESSSPVLDGSLTRMLFTPSSPLTLQSHGKAKAKRFSKFYVARLFKQGQLQPRNVKPLEPKENGPASRVFERVAYVDIGDEPPGEVPGPAAPALQDPTAKTIENWIDELNVDLPTAEQRQTSLEEVRSDGAAKGPIPSSDARDGSSRDLQSVTTRQETIDDAPSWDKAPVRPSPISAVQHTINWDGYEQPGKIPHKFPPLPETDDDKKEDTGTTQTQQKYQLMPGTRNSGRIELVMPQRGGYPQPVRGGSRTSRAGFALNQRGGSHQTGQDESHYAGAAGNVRYRQANKASQKASSRGGKGRHQSPSKRSDRQPLAKENSTPGANVLNVSRPSAATTNVPTPNAPKPSTAMPRQAWSKVVGVRDSAQMRRTNLGTARTDPSPRNYVDVSRENDEADDEEEEVHEQRRFISTLLKAPAPAGRKKPPGSQKKQQGVSTRNPLAHLKEEYHMQPRAVKKRGAFNAELSEDLINMNSSADERDGNLSTDTTSVSTFPSSTGATSSSAASQIHADLQGLNIGCRMDATTKKSIQATHQGLEFARSFQGKIEVVAQVGQVILMSLSPAMKKMMNQDSFVPSVRVNEDETMFKSLEGNFTSAITATMSDMDSLLDLVGVRSTDKPYETRTFLNFECVEPDKTVINLLVPGDTFGEQPRFASAPKLFSSWYAHHPQRVWDSRIIVAGQTEMYVEEHEGGLEFVHDLYVRKQEQCIGPDIQGCDDNGLELRAAQIHTIARYSLGSSRSLLDGDDDSGIRECYIELKRVLDLQIFRRASTTDAESRVFFAQCLPESEMIEDQRLWYEVSFGFIRSPPAFQENAMTLELGDKAAWKPKDAVSEDDLLGLHNVVTRAVEKMDNIGARNRGLGAKYEQREKNKSSDTATRTETFW